MPLSWKMICLVDDGREKWKTRFYRGILLVSINDIIIKAKCTIGSIDSIGVEFE